MQHITDLAPMRPRDPDGHKGTYGTVLIIAGSRGMSGAATLAGLGALRSGAGLTRIACPIGIQPIVAGFHPALMTTGLPEDDRGRIRFDAAQAELAEALESADAVVIGPGLGRSEELKRLVAWLVANVAVAAVIDADGLNALNTPGDLPGSRKTPLVLTPHPGEFARLTGTDVTAVQADREGQAVALARRGDPAVVVLKGSRTLVTDGQRLYRNATGNPGMATGGTGDVLSGMIGALLAQQLDPFHAAALATRTHGQAGDRAAARLGELALSALDLAEELGPAWLAEQLPRPPQP